MRMVMACPACGATGIVRQEWCTRCGGDGRASSSVTLSVVIPPGEQPDPFHDGLTHLCSEQVSSVSLVVSYGLHSLILMWSCRWLEELAVAP